MEIRIWSGETGSWILESGARWAMPHTWKPLASIAVHRVGALVVHDLTLHMSSWHSWLRADSAVIDNSYSAISSREIWGMLQYLCHLRSSDQECSVVLQLLYLELTSSKEMIKVSTMCKGSLVPMQALASFPLLAVTEKRWKAGWGLGTRLVQRYSSSILVTSQLTPYPLFS